MTIGKTGYISSPDLAEGAYKLLNVTSDDLDIIMKHYDVSKNALEEMLASIKEWYEKQPHLPQGQLSNEIIIRHLITRGFSVERVKEKLDHYFSARGKGPEILCNRDPMDPNIQRYLQQGFWIPLPKKALSGSRIVIFRCVSEDFTVIDAMKIAFIIGDYRLQNDYAIGDEYILDLKKANLNHTMQMTPMMISKILFYATDCFGPKIKGIHLVNVPSYAIAIVNLFKKAMKTKLAQRMHVYENFHDILKSFPKQMIPKDLGGEEISFQEIADNWTKVLQSSAWRQRFIDLDKVLTDESKRPNRQESDDVYGTNGSFRKLDLD